VDKENSEKEVKEMEEIENMKEVSSMQNKYPDNIMVLLRDIHDLEPKDTSRDEEFNNMTPNEVFNSVLNWEGIIHYSDTIIGWVKDIYGVSLGDLYTRQGVLPLKDRPDHRVDHEIVVGDLLALRFFDDPKYTIALVVSGEEYKGELGTRSVTFEEIVQAHHAVLLMDADHFSSLVERASQDMFQGVCEAFPEVKTGDFSPEATFELHGQITSALLHWLNWNYPKE